MEIVRAFKRLVGLLGVAEAALLGLIALVGYFVDGSGESRSIAAIIGGLAVLLLVIGLRWLRGKGKANMPSLKPSNLYPERQANIGIVRAFKRLLGLLLVAVAALLGLIALVGYFADNTAESRTIDAVIGGLAVLLLVIGLRWLRHIPREKAAISDALPTEDVEQEWEDPALIYDDNVPWRPWMRKGRLYRAIRERRYIRVAYQKKDGEEATVRILYPKKITKGRLRADDLTPGKTPGSKLFIVERITYVQLLPKKWTPMELGR